MPHEHYQIFQLQRTKNPALNRRRVSEIYRGRTEPDEPVEGPLETGYKEVVMRTPLRVVTVLSSVISFISYCVHPASAGQLSFGNSASNTYIACASAGNMTAVATKTYQGNPPLIWEMYKDNALIQKKTTYPPFAINGTAKASFSVPAVAGSYRVHARSGSAGIFTSPESTNTVVVSVVNNWWGNIPAFSINNLWFYPGGVGGPATQFAPTAADVYQVKAGGPITFNGGLSCGFGGRDFFVSIQLSDVWWNRYNHEAMSWFRRDGSNSSYGGLTNFNLKKFAQDRWFIFVPGQYYRVKLAFGNPWRETTRLVKIIP